MIRVAIAGAGRAATLWGLVLAQSSVPAEVVAVASPHTPRSEHLAKLLGARRVPAERIGEIGADLVVVAVPPEVAVDVAVIAATSGAAVVIERPMVANLADADRLVALAGRGHWLAVAENVLYSPLVTRAQRELAVMSTPSYLAVRAELAPNGGPEHRAGQPGDSWPSWLQGATAVALALSARPGLAPVAVEPGAAVGSFRLRYRSELFTDIELLVVPGPRRFDLQAAAPDGVLRLELLPDPHVERDGVDIVTPAPPSDTKNALTELATFGYLAQAQAIVDDVENGRPPAVDARVGRTILEILTAAAAVCAGAGSAALPWVGRRDGSLAPLPGV